MLFLFLCKHFNFVKLICNRYKTNIKANSFKEIEFEPIAKAFAVLFFSSLVILLFIQTSVYLYYISVTGMDIERIAYCADKLLHKIGEKYVSQYMFLYTVTGVCLGMYFIRHIVQ